MIVSILCGLLLFAVLAMHHLRAEIAQLRDSLVAERELSSRSWAREATARVERDDALAVIDRLYAELRDVSIDLEGAAEQRDKAFADVLRWREMTGHDTPQAARAALDRLAAKTSLDEEIRSSGVVSVWCEGPALDASEPKSGDRACVPPPFTRRGGAR